jgi:hypothetical protein
MLTPKTFAPARPLPPDARKTPTSFVRAVGQHVPRLTAKVFEKYGFHSAEIMTSWSTVAGADIARISSPERIKWPRGNPGSHDAEDARSAAGGATLVLRTEPAYALDVEYKTREIIDRINRYFGYRAIAQIKIIQTPLAYKQPDQAAPARPKQPMADAAALPPPIPSDAEPELKTALSALWSSISAERASR